MFVSRSWACRRRTNRRRSPRSKVADALRYLENQKSRMHYDEYRRMGLPITSSHIESTIKQINRRVKGTEKFWSEGGAEALLQLAADYLERNQPACHLLEGTARPRYRPTPLSGRRVRLCKAQLAPATVRFRDYHVPWPTP